MKRLLRGLAIVAGAALALSPVQAHAYPRSAYPGPQNKMVAHPAGFSDSTYVQIRGEKVHCSVPLGTATSGSVKVRVRFEMVPLFETLLRLTETKYGYHLKASETGGYNCRFIRGSSKPSNHAYGRAVDLNWNANPMGSRFVSDIPPEVVKLWMRHGFYWGGHYRNRPDAMHFEFVDTFASIEAHTANAKKELGGAPAPTNPAPKPNPPQSCSTVSLSSYPLVDKGDKGTSVTTAQCYLRANGYAIEVDGVFGAKTTEAVKAFQKAKGLKVDGKVGKHTWTALLSQGSSPTLKEGSTGGDVTRLQRALRASGQNLSADGRFGPRTEQAVKAYQRQVGLTPDGVVGAKTWAALQAGR
ncbi:MAG: peptidoglycan-binding protein [Actinomycetia bacterium]|nr:peptidoglycan-binding protein [Actinomycetes bacterium]